MQPVTCPAVAAPLVACLTMPVSGVDAHLYNPYPCPALTVKPIGLSYPAHDESRTSTGS